MSRSRVFAVTRLQFKLVCEDLCVFIHGCNSLLFWRSSASSFKFVITSQINSKLHNWMMAKDYHKRWQVLRMRKKDFCILLHKKDRLRPAILVGAGRLSELDVCGQNWMYVVTIIPQKMALRYANAELKSMLEF